MGDEEKIKLPIYKGDVVIIPAFPCDDMDRLEEELKEIVKCAPDENLYVSMRGDTLTIKKLKKV